jgi:nitrogen fixation/metabolism regulation signal transduction histidine kinase
MTPSTLTIRAKLTLWYTVALSGILFTFSVVVFVALRQITSLRADSELREQVAAVGTMLQHGYHSQEQIREDLDDLEEFSAASMLRITNADTVVLRTEGWADAGLDSASLPVGITASVAWTNAQGQRFRIVEVLDEGPGIPPDECARVFDRFYRIDKARSESAGGSGLGLAIVKWAVECSGGHIQASRSSQASGAVFRISLPRCA